VGDIGTLMLLLDAELTLDDFAWVDRPGRPANESAGGH
jgi:hypothetical protein